MLKIYFFGFFFWYLFVAWKPTVVFFCIPYHFLVLKANLFFTDYRIIRYDIN